MDLIGALNFRKMNSNIHFGELNFGLTIGQSYKRYLLAMSG